MQENNTATQQVEPPIHEQIKSQIDKHGLKQAKLIPLLGLNISTGHFCQMLSGKKRFTPEILSKLQAHLAKFQ